MSAGRDRARRTGRANFAPVPQWPIVQLDEKGADRPVESDEREETLVPQPRQNPSTNNSIPTSALALSLGRWGRAGEFTTIELFESHPPRGKAHRGISAKSPIVLITVNPRSPIRIPKELGPFLFEASPGKTDGCACASVQVGCASVQGGVQGVQEGCANGCALNHALRPNPPV